MSMDVFSRLDPKVRKIVGERFKKPTPVQQEVIPRVLDGKNTLVISETGSGKTESVMLPVFSQWVKEKHTPISILYITPLRSLNRDMLKRILWWGQKLDMEVSVRHGDTSQYERRMQAQNPPQMIISTPETLQAVLTGKLLREHLKNVKHIIIDEVHELVSSKRGVQLSLGLERLKNLIRQGGGKDPQIVGLSATVGSPEEVSKYFLGKDCGIADTVSTTRLSITVESPEPGERDSKIGDEMFMAPSTTVRVRRIENLIKEKESVLVFTNTREASEILSSRLKVLNPDMPIETHHSSLSKEVRVNAEDGFKEEDLKALICTSSLELGIDVGSIDYVVQYMSPRQTSKLLQRIGRSGHTLKDVSAGTVIASDPGDCLEAGVIAGHALKGRLEPTRVYGKSLDVLVHQIVGMALEEYNIPVKKVYDTIRKAYPYRNVGRKEFDRICRFCQKLGLVWVGDRFTEKPVISRRRKAWDYYYQNLSTIPDVRTYKIIDIVENQPVGTLDAEFIALHGSPGTSFIVKGRPWRILEVSGDRVMVEPRGGVQGSIPAWEGELIPVPYIVAQDVGKLRQETLDRLGKKPLEWLTENYPLDRNAAEKVVKTVRKQSNWGPVPTDRRIVIEHGTAPAKRRRTGNRLDGLPEKVSYVIIHTCFGSMVNETIGRAVSTVLMNRIGSVGLQTDPYRIILKMPEGSDPEDAVRAFRNLEPEKIKPMLELALSNTEMFGWRFIHVAKRFGIISRDADFGKAYLRKVIEAYTDSPAYEETMNEIWTEKLDAENAERVMGKVRDGKIEITVKEGISPLGKDGIMTRYEVLAQERPEKEIFRAFKERLLDTKVTLACTQCGWSIPYRVKDVPEEIECRYCGSKLMAVVKNYGEDLIKQSLRGKELEGKDLEDLNRLMDTASLVVGSGRDAVIALAGRGVGTRTAGRILNKRKTGDELLQDVLQAEQEYARTKQYWR